MKEEKWLWKMLDLCDAQQSQPGVKDMFMMNQVKEVDKLSRGVAGRQEVDKEVPGGYGGMKRRKWTSCPRGSWKSGSGEGVQRE